MSGWTTARPCERCSRTDRCSISLDGAAAICRTPEAWHSKDTIRLDQTGEEYIAIREESLGGSYEPIVDVYRPSIASQEIRAATYTEMLRALRPGNRLIPADLEHLHSRRGMTFEMIERNQYWSHPQDAAHRSDAARKVFDKVGLDALLGTPGFYRGHREGFVCLNGPGGLGIPVRDIQGRIVGARIRVQDADRKRYLWLSAPSMLDIVGAGAISQVHVPLHDANRLNGTVGITEGEIKADIATERTGGLYISIPGVSHWRLALEVLRQLGAKRVLLAFDGDARRKSGVAGALQRLAGAASAEGMDVSIQVWPERITNGHDQWKGIDDVLSHREGGPELIEVISGAAAWERIAELAASASAKPDPCVGARAVVARVLAGSSDLTTMIFAQEVIDAALILREHAFGEFVAFKCRIKERHAPVRDFMEALNRAERRADEKVLGDGFARTDVGNAERLVAAHGNSLHHTRQRGWFYWTGERWQHDEVRVWQHAKSTVRSLQDTADVQLQKYGRQSEDRRRLAAMIELAEKEPGIPMDLLALDANPWLLNTLNGIVDLRTGDLGPHLPASLQAKIAPVAYDPRAEAPKWQRFLERVVPDAEVRAFLQRAVGYSCTGVVHEHCFLFLYGTGRNGKSVFVGTIHDVLGDYAWQANRDLLLMKSVTHPTERASLLGRRFAVCSEIAKEQTLNSELVKELTGGDPINARFMFRDEFTFKPTHKLWVVGNHRPKIEDTTDSIWERLNFVPFPVHIPESERDPALPEHLRSEMSGILRWIVEGCLAWQSMGLSPPKAVRAATRDYQINEDVLGRFFAERCVANPGFHCGATELHQAFNRWLEERGERPQSQRAFGESLISRNEVTKQTYTGRIRYNGLRLKSSDELRESSGGDGDLGDLPVPPLSATVTTTSVAPEDQGSSSTSPTSPENLTSAWEGDA